MKPAAFEAVPAEENVNKGRRLSVLSSKKRVEVFAWRDAGSSRFPPPAVIYDRDYQAED
jgi:hypothetical protein